MKIAEQDLRFTTERKGYTKREVDEFLLAEKNKNETVHQELKDRINALVEENVALKKTVEEYKQKENKIAEAILTAKENADKMTAEIKLRYMMELDRLNLFRAKWTGVYDELKQRYGFDGDALNVESVVVSTKLEIERFLQRDFSLSKGSEDMSAEESFRLEAERLSRLPSSVNDLKNKLIEAMKSDKVASSIVD